MGTPFLDAPGTHGFYATPFNVLTTELNALASGAACTSSVGGSSGVFGPSQFANAPYVKAWFTSGGAFTPALGGTLSIWWLDSTDGGTTFGSLVATPSTTVPPLPGAPDIILNLDNAAYASGNIRFAPKFWKKAFTPCNVVLWNASGVALPSTGNILTLGPVAEQFGT